MKRFASLDFLRGLAIFLMIFLHSLADFLDIGGIMPTINDIPLMNMVALVVVPFLGGLAGLFLLVSSISNMVSMTKQLMKGRSVLLLALRQFLGGFILYIFAMLSEGTIGYYGAIGGLTRRLNNPLLVNWDTVWTRWGTFETIHTIAWCIMINGVIHALLSIKGLWKKPKIQMAIYTVLAVTVVSVTKFVWMGAANVVPGFPWDAIEGGYSPYKPHFINSTFLQIIQGAFFGALAGPMEPIFPYLALSFIGSIIGIAITQPKKAMFKGFIKVILIIALCMFLVGAAGVIYTIVGVMNTDGFTLAVEIYERLPYHRHWAPDLYPQLTWYSYLWQFLSVNGFSMMIVFMFIYLVDFRGKGQKFAEKTKFIRRFGFAAFSNYNQQYIYPLVNFFIPPLIFGTGAVAVWLNSKLPFWDSGLGAYGKTGWFGTFFQIGVVILIYQVVMLLWEKVNYRGSLEWFIGTIGYYLVPGKKSEVLKNKRWYEKGDLLVEEAFYNTEWVNITEFSEEEYHRGGRDSKLVLILAICCLFPLFIPVSGGLFFIIRKTMKKEGKNKRNKTAMVICIIEVVITIAFFVFVNIVSPSLLGIAI